MGKIKPFEAEQVWLRSYLDTWPNEVFVATEAERSMIANRVFLPEVLALLRTCPVVESEKLDAGARLVVEGATCDGDFVRVVCDIDCGTVQVAVVDVLRM